VRASVPVVAGEEDRGVEESVGESAKDKSKDGTRARIVGMS